MKPEKQFKKAFSIAAAAAVMLFLSLPHTSQAAEKHRLAITYLKQIKPYADLNDAIVSRLQNKLQVKSFALDLEGDNRLASEHLTAFGADIVCSIGHRAREFCQSLNVANIIAVYDTDLLNEAGPFHALSYLQPNAAKVVAIDDNSDTQKTAQVLRQAKEFGLKLTTKSRQRFSKTDLLENDAVILNWEILLVNTSPKTYAGPDRPVAVVVDTGVEAYELLQRQCLEALPPIDRVVIDTNQFTKPDDLTQKLLPLQSEIILSVGANSYRYCRLLADRCRVFVVVRTPLPPGRPDAPQILEGVNVFAEPAEQTKVLNLLVSKPLTLAVPYNPANTELLLIKALLLPQNNIEFVPMPVCDTGHASRVIIEALSRYRGIWVVPDTTLSVEPIQKLLLEESLQTKKMLVAMMHPYTKRGAMMAVSGIGEDNTALCEKTVELINRRLEHPDSVPLIISPPVSVSLNLRTIKRLNCKLPKSLLQKAERVFGEDGAY